MTVQHCQVILKIVTQIPTIPVIQIQTLMIQHKIHPMVTRFPGKNKEELLTEGALEITLLIHTIGTEFETV